MKKNINWLLLFCVIAALKMSSCVTYKPIEKEGGLVYHIEIKDSSLVKNTIDLLKNRIKKYSGIVSDITYSNQHKIIKVEIPKQQDTLAYNTLFSENVDLLISETYDNKDLFDILQKISEERMFKKSYLNENIDLEKNLYLFNYLRPQLATQNYYDKSTKYNQENTKNGVVKYTPKKGSRIGVALLKDTLMVNRILNHKKIKALFPNDVEFIWSKNNEGLGSLLSLYAIKKSTQTLRINKESILELKLKKNAINRTVIGIKLTREFERKWHLLTKRNVHKFLAILINGKVQMAPKVITPILGGYIELPANKKDTEKRMKIIYSSLSSGEIDANIEIKRAQILKPKR